MQYPPSALHTNASDVAASKAKKRHRLNLFRRRAAPTFEEDAADVQAAAAGEENIDFTDEFTNHGGFMKHFRASGDGDGARRGVLIEKEGILYITRIGVFFLSHDDEGDQALKVVLTYDDIKRVERLK